MNTNKQKALDEIQFIKKQNNKESKYDLLMNNLENIQSMFSIKKIKFNDEKEQLKKSIKYTNFYPMLIFVYGFRYNNFNRKKLRKVLKYIRDMDKLRKLK